MTRRRRTMNTRYRILLNLPLLIIFRTAISVFCFWIWEENYLSPWLDAPIAASCKFLRISPTLLPSLILHISRVPNHSRLQSSRLTKPPNGTVSFDSSNSEVMWDYYKIFPNSGCPFPRLSLLHFPCKHYLARHPFRILYVITRIRLDRVGLIFPLSLTHSVRCLLLPRESSL